MVMRRGGAVSAPITALHGPFSVPHTSVPANAFHTFETHSSCKTWSVLMLSRSRV